MRNEKAKKKITSQLNQVSLGGGLVALQIFFFKEKALFFNISHSLLPSSWCWLFTTCNPVKIFVLIQYRLYEELASFVLLVTPWNTRQEMRRGKKKTKRRTKGKEATLVVQKGRWKVLFFHYDFAFSIAHFRNILLLHLLHMRTSFLSAYKFNEIRLIECCAFTVLKVA